MFHVSEACDGKGTLTVKDGVMTIHISLGSKKILNLYPGLAEDAAKEGAVLLEPTTDTVTYSDGMTEEVYGFDVPVPAIGEEFDLALIGTKGKWYDHKVVVSDPVTEDSEGGVAPFDLSTVEDGSYTIELTMEGGSGRQRYLGYLKAMEEAGLTVTDSRMVWIDTDESKQLGYCRDRILNRVEECTALLAYNDQIAFQLIRMLTERNIRVPEDVSVISIDDSDLARHSEVPITSLPHPKENLGKKAAETLLQMIAGRKKDLTYEFDTRVVERESVAECTENGNKK